MDTLYCIYINMRKRLWDLYVLRKFRRGKSENRLFPKNLHQHSFQIQWIFWHENHETSPVIYFFVWSGLYYLSRPFLSPSQFTFFDKFCLDQTNSFRKIENQSTLLKAVSHEYVVDMFMLSCTYILWYTFEKNKIHVSNKYDCLCSCWMLLVANSRNLCFLTTFNTEPLLHQLLLTTIIITAHDKYIIQLCQQTSYFLKASIQCGCSIESFLSLYVNQ